MNELEQQPNQPPQHTPPVNDALKTIGRTVSLVSGIGLIGVSIYGAISGTISETNIGAMLTASIALFTLTIRSNSKE